MSITLKLKHVEGLLLRNQSAHKLDRTVDGTIVKGEEWRFDPDVDPQHKGLKQDEDPRKVETDGSYVKLGTYTIYITAGLKNLVVEKKGKIEHIDFRNSSLRNQIRVRYQKLVNVNAGKDGKKPDMKWQNDGQPQYVPANAWTGVSVGDGQRAIVDEMPT